MLQGNLSVLVEAGNGTHVFVDVSLEVAHGIMVCSFDPEAFPSTVAKMQEHGFTMPIDAYKMVVEDQTDGTVLVEILNDTVLVIHPRFVII